MNQRSEARKKIVTFTPVYALPQKSILGYVGDLTLKGVMVVGEKEAALGAQVLLGIDFPSGAVAIPARAAWSRRDEDDAYFNVGFEFVNLSAENAAAIEAALARYQFRPALSR
ncbi:MAG: hypothetical protein Fur002_19710 [Anaerolineales bacterium]